MVKITLPAWLEARVSDATPTQVALGALAATLISYSLFSLATRKSPHETYAETLGLTDVKEPRGLKSKHWLLGDAVELAKNGTRFPDWVYENALEADGQAFILQVPLMFDIVVVPDPVLVEDVLKTQNDTFGKGERMGLFFHDLMGRALVMQDGAVWFHQRKVASKFFSARMYREVATEMINRHAEKVCAVLSKSCDSGEQINLSKLFHEFTLEAIAELAFGLKMDVIGRDGTHPLDQALENALHHIQYRATTPLWLWRFQRFLNIGSEATYMQNTRYIRSLVAEMVEKSITLSSTQGERKEAATIIELFVHAAQDGESGITPDLICDVAIAFATGGRDTTADTLDWLFLMFSKHPNVVQKLRDELWVNAPELMRGEIKTLSMEQTQGLVYMEAVVRETLRLYPPVPASGREASRDAVLVDGTFIRKGAAVVIPTYAMGRMTSIWGEDASEFKPERFIDPETGKPRKVSAFQFPAFHAGPRTCIGMNLALLEVKLLVAMLLSRFELEIAPNDGSYGFSSTLPLKNPLITRVRHASAVSY